MKSLRSQQGFTVFELLYIVGLWFMFGIVGWGLNLYQVIAYAPAKLGDATIPFVLHAIGVIVVPLGSLMGWIGLLFGVV